MVHLTNPDEPVFPKIPTSQQDMGIYWPGLTKREWFAGMAMQGFCGSASKDIAKAGPVERARWAIVEADALIKELSK